MRGSKLTAKAIRDYKKIYLETLDKFSGIDYLAVAHLESDVMSTIGWDYYQRKWRKEDNIFKNRVDLIKIDVTEFVIGKLLKNINEGDVAAQKFYLNTQAKWSEKTEQKIQHSADISINIISNKSDIDNQQNKTNLNGNKL
jgi:hypothetical protein